MRGQVTAALEAVIALRIEGPDGRHATVDATIDTGFTDYLTLPPSVIAMLRLPLLDTAECQMADGRVVVMEGFLAKVQWYNSPREAVALATEGGPLIGMSLLRDSRLAIDVRANGSVVIDPL
jgi:clan AA aspartic protease